MYPLVYDAMKRAMDETGEAKIFSANITADDHYEMLARADVSVMTHHSFHGGMAMAMLACFCKVFWPYNCIQIKYV